MDYPENQNTEHDDLPHGVAWHHRIIDPRDDDFFETCPHEFELGLYE